MLCLYKVRVPARGPGVIGTRCASARLVGNPGALPSPVRPAERPHLARDGNHKRPATVAHDVRRRQVHEPAVRQSAPLVSLHCWRSSRGSCALLHGCTSPHKLGHLLRAQSAAVPRVAVAVAAAGRLRAAAGGITAAAGHLGMHPPPGGPRVLSGAFWDACAPQSALNAGG